ncbi:MAG TPA: hypothetical protein ENI14_00340 [Thermoplasmatales archaeon]|nr:hypothetical protein [Thermoplasmatales archaeon]
MALEDILSKIKEEADREIEQILSRAREEKNKRLKEAEKEINEEKEQRIKRAERELENRKKAEIAKIRQEARKEVMQLKEKMIKECFDRALERLRNMRGKDYEMIVESLMRSTMKEIGKNCIVIPSREEDAKIAKKLGLKVENRKIESAGGFIAKSKDGRITIDNRFRSILKRKEKEIRAKVGSILFGGE